MILDIREFSIITIEKNSSPIDYAAKELQDYFLEMQDKYVPINCFDKPYQIILSYDHNSFGLDGYHIVINENEIKISGDSRGVIYGVYELLERFGCRFFAEDAEYIPRLEKLSIDCCDEIYAPVLINRDHMHKSAKNIRYALKSRLNGKNTSIPQNLGGKIDYGWFCHSFQLICNPNDYYDEHKEYFSLVPAYNLEDKNIRERFIDDLQKKDFVTANKLKERFLVKHDNFITIKDFEKLNIVVPDYFPKAEMYRIYDHTQLCLTNPDVLEIAKKKVRAMIKEKPECKIISISQNDWDNPCECEECKKIDKENESHAGSMIAFVNAIAEDIEKDFPEYYIDTFAYCYTRNAPTKIKARKNVIVRLCSIECCFTHPLGECDYNKNLFSSMGKTTNFISDIKNWSKCCQNLWIWDYTTNYSHYLAPHGNWKTLQKNAQFFVKHGVNGIMEQGNYSHDGGTDLNELRSYLIGKILWNPDCDVEKHKEEFLDYYYGEAAPYINEYINIMLNKIDKENIHCNFAYDLKQKHFSKKMIDKYDQLFQNAIEAVKNDPIRFYRIHKAYLSIRYIRLKNDMYEKKIDKNEIAKFFNDCREFGIFRVEEWCNMGKSRRAFIDGNNNGFSYIGDFCCQADPFF